MRCVAQVPQPANQSWLGAFLMGLGYHSKLFGYWGPVPFRTALPEKPDRALEFPLAFESSSDTLRRAAHQDPRMKNDSHAFCRSLRFVVTISSYQMCT